MDVAKAIGIFIVVIGHITKGSIITFTSFKMPLFFIISGILLFYNNRWKDDDFGFTIKRKAKSFLWPYLVFSIISILGDVVFKPESLLHNFILFISTAGIGVLWFLSTLFFAEIIFIFILKKCNFKLRAFCIGLMLIFTSAYILLINNFGFDENSVMLLICRPLLACIFLFIGYYSTKFKSKISLSNLSDWIILAIGFILIFINLYLSPFASVNFVSLDISNLVIFYINAIVGSFGVIILSKILLEKSCLLIFYGKYSLIVYITHLLLIKTLNVLHISLLSSNIVMFFVVMIIDTIIVLLINKYLRFLINYDAFKDLVLKCKSILR